MDLEKKPKQEDVVEEEVVREHVDTCANCSIASRATGYCHEKKKGVTDMWIATYRWKQAREKAKKEDKPLPQYWCSKLKPEGN